MDLEQSYHYQPWNDNKWLIQELMDNDVIIEKDNKINDKSYLSYEQRTFGFQARHWTY